jgi:hypothetical protein
MILKDPNDFPPPDEDETTTPTPNGEEPSELGLLIGTIVVNGVIQIALTFWDKWLIMSLFGVTINALLWWIGMTIFFVSLDVHKKDINVPLMINKVLISIFLTLYIWIFL